MDSTTIVMTLLGGIIIGLAAGMLLLWNGRIAGISGIFGGLLLPGTTDRSWRLLFVLGLGVGGLLLLLIAPSLLPIEFSVTGATSWTLMILGGLLVGFGTRLGSGCTSGHGVCGLSRLSPRSIVATATFIGVGMLTVLIFKHVLGV